jgi:hypothetical protein
MVLDKKKIAGIYWKELIAERTVLSVLGEHMFHLTSGSSTVLISDHLPLQDEVYREHASLIEHKASATRESLEHFLYLAVSQSHHQWSFLVVTLRSAPGPDAGFYPGVLLLPATSLLFIGAGERLLAYRLDQKALLWEDSADTGFWGGKNMKMCFLCLPSLNWLPGISRKKVVEHFC